MLLYWRHIPNTHNLFVSTVPKSSDTEDDFSDTDDSSDIDTEESSGDIVVEFHPKCTICKDVIKDIKKKIEASPAEVRICWKYCEY